MDRTVGGVQITSDGRGSDVGLGCVLLAGAATLAGFFSVGGWIRLGMQALGGLLLLPLLAFVLLMIFGGAVNALLKPAPTMIHRLALAFVAVLIGVGLGSTAPGSPQELIVTPLGLFWAGWLLRAELPSDSGRRRRAAIAIAIAIAALSAGATGLWLLR